MNARTITQLVAGFVLEVPDIIDTIRGADSREAAIELLKKMQQSPPRDLNIDREALQKLADEEPEA